MLASASMGGALIASRGWAAQPCPPPQVSLSGGTSATTNCVITSGRSYSTNFSLTESTISEGGVWSHLASSWQRVQTSGRRAHAAAYTEAYDDAYALLGGFPPNVQVEATIYKNGSPSYEVELLLRAADTSNSVRGYECLLNVAGGGVQLVRWNGPLGNFTEFGNVYAAPAAVTGDKIRARIVGNFIQFWHIPASTGTARLIADGTDSTFNEGQPGLSFYVHTPVNRTDVGVSDYSVISV